MKWMLVRVDGSFQLLFFNVSVECNCFVFEVAITLPFSINILIRNNMSCHFMHLENVFTWGGGK